ncbi:phosphoribosylanthranilate isomerase [Streptomyces celluloflavus]|uniref:phosphoribosylanthranilate isomerase n=1 Tax=Streptomyces celluloflavus TaxID=58344 RepID=UPI0036CD57B2
MSTRTQNHLFINLCGLRTERDVDKAVEAGAEAIGFMFANSSRQVDATTAVRLVRRVPSGVMTVGGFRDQAVLEVWPRPRRTRPVIPACRSA